MLLDEFGVCRKFELPEKLSPIELELLDKALYELEKRVHMAKQWHAEQLMEQETNGSKKACACFSMKRTSD